jgi:isopenicillin N synthase-like dioxygenase
LPAFRADAVANFIEAAHWSSSYWLAPRRWQSISHIHERFFDRYFTERGRRACGLLHYPPHPGTSSTVSVYGAGAHTDYGNLTLLAQDTASAASKCANATAAWTIVPPVAGTFVCNIGDCLMRWTNDVYVSNAHRVVNQSGRERYSVAYFGDPNSDALVCVSALGARARRRAEVPVRSPTRSTCARATTRPTRWHRLP